MAKNRSNDPYPSWIKYAVVHHTEVRAIKNSRQLGPVNRYHQQKWNRISSLGYYVGYTWFCDVDGTLTQTRAIGEETMAQLWHNHDSESICLAGNFNVDKPTKAQIKTLTKWLTTRSHLEIKLHRELNFPRTCPGKRVSKKWIMSLVNTKQQREKIPLIDGVIAVIVLVDNHQTTSTSQEKDLIIELRIKRAKGTITTNESMLLEDLIQKRDDQFIEFKKLFEK